jgi:hypothetical protein
MIYKFRLDIGIFVIDKFEFGCENKNPCVLRDPGWGKVV